MHAMSFEQCLPGEVPTIVGVTVPTSVKIAFINSNAFKIGSKRRWPHDIGASGWHLHGAYVGTGTS